jgi:hypothetical protein
VISVHVLHARSGAGDDGCHALAIAFADQPQRIARKVLTTLWRTEDAAKVVEGRITVAA